MSLGHPVGPKAVLRYCNDCGRRFANLGWHAEACGSPDAETSEATP